MRKKLVTFCLLLWGVLGHSQAVLLDENFDSYTDFTISGFGDWQTLDSDGQPTYNGSTLPGSITPNWPNAGAPMAFQIFNPSVAGVTNNAFPLPGVFEVRNFDPHSGLKYAASWRTTPANNDWLITPSVTLGLGSNVLTLWVKSACTSPHSPERYRIGIYTGSGMPSSSFDFIIISSPLIATQNWQQITYDLNAYGGQSIRVGIQCISTDGYMFMVDDVKITTATLSTNEVSKSKTSIFPNPTHGEINIRTDKKIQLSTILDASGKKVMTADSEMVNISSLPKGIYLLQVEFADGSTSREKIIKE